MAKDNEAQAEVDLEAYLAKAPTDLQARFAEYIKDVVGYDPSTAKNKDEAFKEGVRLATALRMVFQASDENRKATALRRKARAEAAEAADEDETPKVKAKKAKPVEEAPAAAPAKAKKAKSGQVTEEAPKAKSGKAKKSKRAAAATADSEDVAPF